MRVLHLKEHGDEQNDSTNEFAHLGTLVRSSTLMVAIFSRPHQSFISTEQMALQVQCSASFALA